MDENGRPMGTPKSARGQNYLIWGPRLRCPRVLDTCAPNNLTFHTCARSQCDSCSFRSMMNSLTQHCEALGPVCANCKKDMHWTKSQEQWECRHSQKCNSTHHSKGETRWQLGGCLSLFITLWYFMMSARSRSTRLLRGFGKAPEIQFRFIADKWFALAVWRFFILETNMCLFCRVLLQWEGYTCPSSDSIVEVEESGTVSTHAERYALKIASDTLSWHRLPKAQALQYMWAKHLQQLSSKNYHHVAVQRFSTVCERCAFETEHFLDLKTHRG